MKTYGTTYKAGTKIGALAGGILFLIGGAIPGIYAGGFAALIAMSWLNGGAVEPTVIVRVMTVMGSVIGLCVSATIGVVGGAAVGTALGFVSDVLTGGVTEPGKEAEASKS